MTDVATTHADKPRDRVREMEDELIRMQQRWMTAWGNDAISLTKRYRALHTKWVDAKRQGALL